MAWAFFLLVKLAMGLQFSHLATCDHPRLKRGLWALEAGDTFSYLIPIENWLAEGEYYWFNGQEKVYAGRMPYYGLLYLVCLRLAGPLHAADLLAFLQMALEAAAAVSIAELSLILTGSLAAWWSAYGILLVGWKLSQYSAFLMPEGLAIGFFSLSLVFREKHVRSLKLSDLLKAGLALAIAACFKTYVAVFFALFVPLLLERRSVTKRHGFGVLTSAAACVLLPYLVLQAPWTLRNYARLGRVIVLQSDANAGYFDDAYLAYRTFLGSWGGSSQWWDKRSIGCYFEPAPGFSCEAQLPPYALAPGYGVLEVEQARQLLIASRERPALRGATKAAFDDLTRRYREARPFGYWFAGPIRLLRQFVLHSGSYYLPVNSTSPCFRSWQRYWKLLESALYYSVLIAGTIGLVVGTTTGSVSQVYPLTPLILIGLFCWIFRRPEFRYFDLAWPSLVIGVAWLVTRLAQFSRRAAAS